MSLEQERNLTIDLLRVFGGLIVMAAHVPLAEALFQARNFGTPMLIIVSALAAAVVFHERPPRTLAFLKRRLHKLVLQPWCFLTIFFALFLGAAHLLHKSFPFTAHDVIFSYAFEGGIGYVWIFKVYVTIALITPALIYFKSTASRRTYFGALLMAYVANEAVGMLLHQWVHDEGSLQVIDDTALTVVPYTILFAYGLELAALTDLTVALVAGASFGVFLLLATLKYAQVGHFIATQQFKYPPTLYYLSYGLFGVNTVYLALKSIRVAQTARSALVWLASNMLWIYLWHIMGIFIWQYVAGPLRSGGLWSLIELAFIVGFGICMTRVQLQALAQVAGMAPNSGPTRALKVLFG